MPDAVVAVTYRLRPSAGERLVLAYGVNPDHWLDLPPARARFSVAVRTGGTERDVLAAETDPSFNPADRRWTEAVVDLSPWAGQPIEVVLRVAGPPGMPTRAGMFGWGDPRLIGGGDGQ
jgi:hypothetical protein